MDFDEYNTSDLQNKYNSESEEFLKRIVYMKPPLAHSSIDIFSSDLHLMFDELTKRKITKEDNEKKQI